MAMGNEKELLLAAVRSHLAITWTDPALDARLAGYIERGISRINALGGAEFDYLAEGLHRDLLFERCRYWRSNAGDQFEKDYAPEIHSLRLSREVAQYEADDSAL